MMNGTFFTQNKGNNKNFIQFDSKGLTNHSKYLWFI